LTAHMDSQHRSGLFQLAVVGCAMVSVAFLCSGEASAQLTQAIPTKDLVEPWNRAADVIRSLRPSFGTLDEREKRQLDRELSELDKNLAELESQEQTVAIKIVSYPEFAYVVSESSDLMAEQLTRVENGFAGMLEALPVSGRPDASAMGASLKSLRDCLSKNKCLERDVLQALGSGSKNQIQSLAASWWEGSESVGRLREVVATARRELAR
jgi:hypothetical protein